MRQGSLLGMGAALRGSRIEPSCPTLFEQRETRHKPARADQGAVSRGEAMLPNWQYPGPGVGAPSVRSDCVRGPAQCEVRLGPPENKENPSTLSAGATLSRPASGGRDP